MTTKPYKSNCSLSPNLYPVRLLLKCSFSMPTLSWCWQALICTKVSTERARRGTLTQHCTPVHISCRIHVARLSSITGLLTEPSFRQASQKKQKTRYTWHWQILKWYTIRNFKESFPIDLLYFLRQMLIIPKFKDMNGMQFHRNCPYPTSILDMHLHTLPNLSHKMAVSCTLKFPESPTALTHDWNWAVQELASCWMKCRRTRRSLQLNNDHRFIILWNSGRCITSLWQ